MMSAQAIKFAIISQKRKQLLRIVGMKQIIA